MSAPLGETHDSNNPQNKRGWGAPIPAPIRPGILLPNYKAKHRAKASGFVFKYELRYWQNRWYVVGRPRYRKLMKKLGLRK